MRAQSQSHRRCSSKLKDVRSVCSHWLTSLSLPPSFPFSSRTFARCAGCRFEFTLRMPDRPASAAAAGAAAAGPTAAEWVRLIPVNSELMDSIHRGRLLERVVSETQRQLHCHGGAIRCIYPQCSQPALFWCEECEGELCAAHDRDLHPKAAAAAASSLSAAPHRCIPLSERAAARQAKMAARLASNGASLRAAVLQTEKENNVKIAAVSARLAAETARVEREVLWPIRARLAGIEAAQRAVKALSAEIDPLSDIELLQHEACILEIIEAAVPPDGLLAELSPERRSDLERFLKVAEVSLVSQTMRLIPSAVQLCLCASDASALDSHRRSVGRVLRCDRTESAACCTAAHATDLKRRISLFIVVAAATPSPSLALCAHGKCIQAPPIAVLDSHQRSSGWWSDLVCT